MRRSVAAVLTALLSTAALAASPGGAAQAHGPAAARPVVFLHGRNADSSAWDTMIARFRAAGTPGDRLFAWTYDTTRSTNEVTAGLLAQYVDAVLRQTGASQVDIVSHSLGSLPSRWYVKFGGGRATVRHWVSLAGPNHGTGIAALCALWDQGCKDMTPGSYVLTHLNSGDESPGPVDYTVLWSPCDETMLPQNSPQLQGARNVRTTCLKHNDLLTDAAVAAKVRATLEAARM
ncbi:triacylglycerol lipase [Streptomyces sp. NPDC049585]|uniref:esterase/lipase family protein n=1 Tax=Streptomyces sp. NPDC049585 TaxID=3155154 RepID=UPI00342463AB